MLGTPTHQRTSTAIRPTLGLLTILCLLGTASAQQQGWDSARWLERHDADGDGAVTQTEFKGPPNLFSRLDADGDKTVSRQEVDAAQKTIRERRAGQPQMRTSPALPDGVTVHRDLEFAVMDDTPLHCDLYLPKQAESAPPLVVWIHGGGWRNGDKARVNPAVLRLTGDGYAVASINYRLENLSIHPKQIHDCKGAVRWLRAHASEYGYDSTRIAVAGSSAGGHLALLLGLSGSVEKLEGTVGGNENFTGPIRAIVDFYGPSDLPGMSADNDRFNQQHATDAEKLVSASPLTYLDSDDPPVLIFHGDQDALVPVAQSQRLHQRYQDAELTSELHVLPGEGHGGPAFSDDERHQQIKTFLDQHLRQPGDSLEGASL